MSLSLLPAVLFLFVIPEGNLLWFALYDASFS
jgi:hypothetical protein